MRKSQETGRPFATVVLQIENIEIFKKRRSPDVVTGLFHQIFHAVRMAVHSSQFVGLFHNGLGLVFDGIDVGQVDTLSAKVAGVAQRVIREGKYNDLTSRWSDIIMQFLAPHNPGILFSKVGWGIYPRDGATPMQLVNRALNHAAELRNR